MNTQETIISRRSVRAYTAQQLTEEHLSNLLNAAYTAPIAGGAHKTMRLTVVQNAEMLSKIGAFYKEKSGMKIDMLYGAPTLIIVSGYKDFDQNALFVNAGCILENIGLSAAAMELGSVINWATGTTLRENAELLKELGISEDFQPLAGIAIGHPAKEAKAREVKPSFETNYIREECVK